MFPHSTNCNTVNLRFGLAFFPLLFQGLGRRWHWTWPHTAVGDRDPSPVLPFCTQELPTGSSGVFVDPEAPNAQGLCTVLPFGRVPSQQGWRQSHSKKSEKREENKKYWCKGCLSLQTAAILTALPLAGASLPFSVSSTTSFFSFRSWKKQKKHTGHFDSSCLGQKGCRPGVKNSLKTAGASFISHPFVLQFGHCILTLPWEWESMVMNLNPSQPCHKAAI